METNLLERNLLTSQFVLPSDVEFLLRLLLLQAAKTKQSIDVLDTSLLTLETETRNPLTKLRLLCTKSADCSTRAALIFTDLSFLSCKRAKELSLLCTKRASGSSSLK